MPGEKLFGLDRTGRLNTVMAGGVCIYLDNKLSAHCSVNINITKCTCDFEILGIDITKPGLKVMTT